MSTRQFILWSLIQLALVLAALRLYGFLQETQYYFTPQDIATRPYQDLNPIAFALALLVPCFAAAVGIYISRAPDSSAVTFGTFLAALLQSWPAIYFPDVRSVLLPDSLKDQPMKILVLYSLYIASYTLLAKATATVTLASRRWTSELQRDGPFREIAVGLAVSAIWQLVVNFWK